MARDVNPIFRPRMQRPSACSNFTHSLWMAYPSCTVMPGYSREKRRSCVRLLRASYSRRARAHVVSLGNMAVIPGVFVGVGPASGVSEARVQIIVLERGRFAE